MKNVACLLSDRSRALAKAIVLKRHDGILFLENQEKVRRYFYVYAKIINMISQKSCIENPHGGGVV